MKEIAKFIVICFVAGLIVVAAGRAAEWLIPGPETRVIICFAGEDMGIDVCKTAAEIMKK